MNYTKESLAAVLNGREYTEEITAREALDADASGLVVVFGASDDLIELRGALHDEADCYEGREVAISGLGIQQEWKYVDHESEEACLKYFECARTARKIKAVWLKDGYSWTYETDIPHATFEVLEDGKKYCRGIVFSVNDL